MNKYFISFLFILFVLITGYSNVFAYNESYADAAFTYFTTGLERYNAGDYEGAIVDLDESIMLNDKYAYAYNIPHLDIVRQLLFMVDDPDLTLYFDVPVDVALDRVSERSFRDKNENVKTLTQAKEGYEHVMGLFDNVYKIDNTLSVLDSFEMVKEKIKLLK